MLKTLLYFWRDETGATAVEYAVWAGFLGSAIAISILSLNPEVEAMFNEIRDAIVTRN